MGNVSGFYIFELYIDQLQEEPRYWLPPPPPPRLDKCEFDERNTAFPNQSTGLDFQKKKGNLSTSVTPFIDSSSK